MHVLLLLEIFPGERRFPVQERMFFSIYFHMCNYLF